MTKGQYLRQAGKRLEGSWVFQDGAFTKYIDMRRSTNIIKIIVSTDGWSGYTVKAECYDNPKYNREEKCVKDVDGIIDCLAEYAEYLDKATAVEKAKEIKKILKEANE